MTRTPAEAVHALWSALSARDWDAVAAAVTDDCIYVDMPVGPTAAARGPVDIVKRLKIGLEALTGYENFDGLLVANDDVVMYEHHETWTFATGEVVHLPFVTVHRVHEGRVCLWKDYWDLGGVVSAAPPTWMEDFAAADMSWMFDATGLI